MRSGALSDELKMAISWQLTRVATDETKTLEQWGIRSAVRSLLNQGTDTLTLGFGGKDLLGNSPFNTAETLRLDRVVDAVPTTVFRGRIIKETRGAHGSSEGFTVVVAGPWWYLEKTIYMQTQEFVVYPLEVDNPVPIPPALQLTLANFATESLTSAQIVLKEDDTGRTVDSKEQIVEAIEYAISKGAPLAIGTIDDGIAVPRDSIQDATCAEIILKSLRWTPDQSAFFDYSVNPPALNIRTRANREALSIDIADKTVAEVEINPQSELAVSGVTLNYQRLHQREFINFVTLDKDQAGPDPEGIGALVMTIELYGSYNIQRSVGTTDETFIVAAEPVPAGLAAILYAAYSTAPYEGRILLAQDECDAFPWINKKLSILNGVPIWSTVEMLVQQSSEDLFAGRTELTVGPPRQLGAPDLLGLVRKGRTKTPPLSSGLGPVIPTPPNPDFPNTSSPDPRIEFSPHNQPDLIIHTWRWINAGGPGWYGVVAYDKCNVTQVEGGISHQLSAGSIADIGTVVDFFGAKIGRGQDIYVGLTGAIAVHDSDAVGPGSAALPTYEIDTYVHPPRVH
jgi:hypothetical protein